MKVLVPLALLAVAGLLLSLAVRLGAFLPVELTVGEAGPFYLVYRRHEGAYYKIAPVISAVEAWAKERGEGCALTFGEYLDDARTADEDRLRSNGGCVLDHPVGPPGDGLFARTLPRRLYVIASFRGAPSIGPYKAYPKAEKWMKETGYARDGATIETYRIESEKGVQTLYYFPVLRAP